MHLYVAMELGGAFNVCSHIVWQEVKCAGVTEWGAGGGDQRDTRTVGNDASRDASDSAFMVAQLVYGCLGGGGLHYKPITERGSDG